MIFHIIAIALLTACAAWTYRAGGSGKHPFWYREAGMMVCAVLGLLSLGLIHWSLILVAGATYGAQTTYFKKKGTDAKWWNWLLVGLVFSLTVLPIVISNHLWIGVLARTVVVTAFTTLWSQFIGKDTLEEYGRGAVQIISLPLLLIS